MDVFLIQIIVVYVLFVIFVIMLYEVVYGYVVCLFGDNIVYVMGCVLFNLMCYIDLFGMIVILFVMYFLIGGVFLFGYVKLVLVLFGNLCNLCWGSLWVVFVGFVCNFVQVFVWGLLIFVLLVVGVDELFFMWMVFVGVSVNFVFGVLNLFLLLLFDGGCILVVLLLIR